MPAVTRQMVNKLIRPPCPAHSRLNKQALDNRRVADRKARLATNYDPDPIPDPVIDDVTDPVMPVTDPVNTPPPSPAIAVDGVACMAAPVERYARLVCDITDLDCTSDATLKGVVAVGVSKHICGSATDVALRALCANVPPASAGRQPSDAWLGHVGAVCMAPCCHQKARLKDYCNPEYLTEIGFGGKHAWGTLTSLIQLSRHTTLADHEYEPRPPPLSPGIVLESIHNTAYAQPLTSCCEHTRNHRRHATMSCYHVLTLQSSAAHDRRSQPPLPGRAPALPFSPLRHATHTSVRTQSRSRMHTCALFTRTCCAHTRMHAAHLRTRARCTHTLRAP